MGALTHLDLRDFCQFGFELPLQHDVGNRLVKGPHPQASEAVVAIGRMSLWFINVSEVYVSVSYVLVSV